MELTKEKKIIYGVIVLVVILIGFLLFRNKKVPQINTINPSVMQLGEGQVRVFGHFSCLPLKSGGDSQTNCIIGLKTHEGVYYGIDISKAKAADPNITPQTSVGLTGTFAEAKKVNDGTYKDYAIEGVIDVLEIGREG
ncbi:MAG: hypothetical protein JWL80_392 [Parcubacteria group bacterium]|nr:hypothetical protein [Parcubacteria group bacterium]